MKRTGNSRRWHGFFGDYPFLSANCTSRLTLYLNASLPLQPSYRSDAPLSRDADVVYPMESVTAETTKHILHVFE
ncbi:hypothetical protein Bpfe_028609 [Biomphalaria pfeifferi]|uniref:Uncharacterized protein n=1 Tax=Biomphalaria pfeifferi TaxID=112525 RepID=A0AAD8AUM4_BIOPF|nr:hypothetical protein Bpfe_028609 [Biomphalaria pfeifferi]